MENLQILKFRFKKGSSLSFTHGTTAEEELKELEGLANVQDDSLEVLNAYLASL